MKVSAICCDNCGDTIYSRAVHDWRECICGEICIDGGFDYIKISFINIDNPPKIIELEVDATKKDLYYDWNHRINKFGRIKNVQEDRNN